MRRLELLTNESGHVSCLRDVSSHAPFSVLKLPVCLDFNFVTTGTIFPINNKDKIMNSINDRYTLLSTLLSIKIAYRQVSLNDAFITWYQKRVLYPVLSTRTKTISRMP